ncbi:hypothetical protein EJ06DRAFT_55899 [Trichodelitschia bisporula]|uniref:MARVEL domain-containing protein n=1 Tax=Trichodelitschia bisporula TaxID=703511 RepID=A0A6G1HTZ2_9PEZI|nr:hypothetical protein EJ06DRAFT_55899 [Trichodelitschia bisporula]
MNQVGLSRDDHIPSIPGYFIALRFLQNALAFGVLGCCIYSLFWLHYFEGLGYSIFVSVISLSACTYYLIARLILPKIYNRIVILVLECIIVVAWLACWSNLASWVTAYTIRNTRSCPTVFGQTFCTRKRTNLPPPPEHWETYRDVMGAAAVMGATSFVLFIASLIVFAVHFYRMHLVRAPYTYNGSWRRRTTVAAGSALYRPATVKTPAQVYQKTAAPTPFMELSPRAQEANIGAL